MDDICDGIPRSRSEFGSPQRSENSSDVLCADEFIQTLALRPHPVKKGEKRLWFVHCEISQYLSVDNNFLAGERRHESAVRHPVRTDGGVNLPLPELPPVALFPFAVSIRMNARFQDRGFRLADAVLSPPPVSFDATEEASPFPCSCSPAFNSHDCFVKRGISDRSARRFAFESVWSRRLRTVILPDSRALKWSCPARRTRTLAVFEIRIRFAVA
jgi:hypothetical protein